MGIHTIFLVCLHQRKHSLQTENEYFEQINRLRSYLLSSLSTLGYFLRGRVSSFWHFRVLSPYVSRTTYPTQRYEILLVHESKFGPNNIARCWIQQTQITPPTSAIKTTLQLGQKQAQKQEMNQGQIIWDTVTGEGESERRARTWPFLNIHDEGEERDINLYWHQKPLWSLITEGSLWFSVKIKICSRSNIRICWPSASPGGSIAINTIKHAVRAQRGCAALQSISSWWEVDWSFSYSQSCWERCFLTDNVISELCM